MNATYVIAVTMSYKRRWIRGVLVTNLIMIYSITHALNFYLYKKSNVAILQNGFICILPVVYYSDTFNSLWEAHFLMTTKYFFRL